MNRVRRPGEDRTPFWLGPLATLAGVGFASLVTLLMLPCLILEGWELSLFWSWFIMPVFPARLLFVGVATGLLLTLHLLFPYRLGKVDLPEKNVLPFLVGRALAPLGGILSGYVVHWLLG
jgi:hypothetical protein